MLKAGARKKDGGHLVLLGLSAENLRRLPNDEPIKLDLAEIGHPEIEIVIFAGDTEESMAQGLQGLIGGDTKVDIDSRLFGGHD